MMNCSEVEELLPDYLQHSLNASDNRSVGEHLEACTECREDVEVWHRLGSVPSVSPGQQARSRFDAMLNAYETRLQEPARPVRVFNSRWAQRVAALLIVAVSFAAGTLVGRMRATNAQLADMQQELVNTRQLVALSLLRHESASDRLEGVIWSERLGRPDPRVLEALLDRLRFDNSVDVRLATLDALRRCSDQPDVRMAVVDSLRDQQSPMVQIALIDFLVESRGHEAIEKLQLFERSRDLLPDVRQKIQWGIGRLRQG